MRQVSGSEWRLVKRADKAALWSAVLMLMAACAGPNLKSSPPAGFNLSGEWRLVVDESDSAPRQGPLADRRDAGRQELARHGIGTDYPVVYAKTMKIDQARDSMGIRYDQSDYRDVSWGERERGMWTIDAGWSGDALYIYSKAHDSKGVEVMRLYDDANTLVVDIEVDAGTRLRLQRVFKRVSGG